MPRTNPTLQELHDLAQGKSYEVRLDGKRVGLGFAKDVAGAELLAELLAVPGDPYRVTRHGNAVVVYLSGDAAAATTVASCLRP